MDMPIPVSNAVDHPFKGNMDTARLKRQVHRHIACCVGSETYAWWIHAMLWEATVLHYYSTCMGSEAQGLSPGNQDVCLMRSHLVAGMHGADGGVACVVLTVTNNSGGGQPVSMSCIKEACATLHT